MPEIRLPYLRTDTDTIMIQFDDNLTPDEYGIWRSSRSYSLSYPEHSNEACFQLEDDSFWFRHRKDCISAAVHRFPPP